MGTSIKLYCENVILPIEEKRNEIGKIVVQKGENASKEERTVLEKYEQTLLEKYQVLETLLQQAFQEEP